MRVLVTGSSGHVGGAIARHLFEREHEVVGVSRRVAALPDAISQVSADIAGPAFVDELERRLERCDAIVHAAAELSKSPYATGVSATNGIGTQQMLEVAEHWGVQSFVFISGVAVIGRPLSLPIKEDHPIAPLTAYHASKVYGEHLVAIAAGSGLAAATLRLTSPVGPSTPAGRIVSCFVERASNGQPLVLHGEGTRRQDYVDVRDAAQAVEKCIQKAATGLFNIGGPEAIANRDLARRCISVLGSLSAIEFSGLPDTDDSVAWEVSCQAAREAFGYEPEHTIESSICAMASRHP